MKFRTAMGDEFSVECEADGKHVCLAIEDWLVPTSCAIDLTRAEVEQLMTALHNAVRELDGEV